MGYLSISRELLNSSFWRSLAPAEKGILVDLMAMAAYKPTTYNLYGKLIELDKYELCFSVAKMAKHFDISDSSFRRFIGKLENNGLLTKKKRKVLLTDRRMNRRMNRHTVDNDEKYQFYTSLTFYTWAFKDDEERSENNINLAQSDEPSEPMFCHTTDEHNKEVFNKEVLNKDTKRNSACANPYERVVQKAEYKKSWYTMEQIAGMDLPLADEIMNEWCSFSGRSKKEILAALEKFTKRQRLFGLPEMTLDIFDKEFRKEMKQVFALKKNHINESKPRLKYLGREK